MTPLSPPQLHCLLTVYLSPGCELDDRELIHRLHGMNHYNGLKARGLLERSADKRRWRLTAVGERAVLDACKAADEARRKT